MKKAKMMMKPKKKIKAIKQHYDLQADTQLEIKEFAAGARVPDFFNCIGSHPDRADEAVMDALVSWLMGYETTTPLAPLDLCYFGGPWGPAELFKCPREEVILQYLDYSAEVDNQFMKAYFGYYSRMKLFEEVRRIATNKNFSGELVALAFACPDPLLAEEILDYLLYNPFDTKIGNDVFSLGELFKIILELLLELEQLETYPDLDLQLLQTYFLQKAKKCKGRIQEPIPCQPSWVNDEAWELYQETKPWKAANLLNYCVQDVINYANGRVIVCLARDFLWLYALLVERGVPAYLAICSRLNIGDLETLEVIQKDLGASGVSLDNCLFVDSQGRGSIYDWMRSEWSLPAENFAFLYSCSDEYVGICQHKLTREKVIKEVEHNLIHPVGRSHNWVWHEGLGYQPVWEIRECIDYEVRSIQQVRALTCLHMGVSMAWNSCMGHTQYERTLGLTLKQDEFPEVYIRVTEDAWDSIRKQGYLNLRETRYSKGLNDPDVRDQYEEKAFNSIVCPSYGYRDQKDLNRWARYGQIILKLEAEYAKFCTSTPGDSLDTYFGTHIQPLCRTMHDSKWEGQEVQIHTFIPPSALKRVN